MCKNLVHIKKGQGKEIRNTLANINRKKSFLSCWGSLKDRLNEDLRGYFKKRYFKNKNKVVITVLNNIIKLEKKPFQLL